MNRLLSWFQDQFQEIFSLAPEHHRLILLKFFRLVGLPVLALFSILDFLRGAYIESFFTMLSLIFIGLSTYIAERHMQEVNVYRIGLGLVTMNFIVGLYTAIDPIYTTFMTLLLPMPIFFLLGAAEGLAWTLVAFISFMAALVSSPLHQELSIIFVFRFALSYFVLSMIALIVEIVRDQVHQLFLEKQEELQKINEEIYHSSIRDSLTGFYNRTFFSDAFENILSQALRVRTPIVIILLDLDNFKTINDDYGHLVGDDTLALASDAIRSKLKRKSDFVIRYGGDEFLIALFDITAERAKVIASNILREISNLSVPGYEGGVNASVGLVELTQWEDRHLNMEDLVRELITLADKNMYRAKNLGGNLVVDEIKLNLE